RCVVCFFQNYDDGEHQKPESIEQWSSHAIRTRATFLSQALNSALISEDWSPTARAGKASRKLPEEEAGGLQRDLASSSLIQLKKETPLLVNLGEIFFVGEKDMIYQGFIPKDLRAGLGPLQVIVKVNHSDRHI
ncbi:hypothetical protein NL676_039896, partial [Syzygium grande]